MNHTTYVPFTVSMKRNAKSTSFTVTDERGIVVATKRSASTGYQYFVVAVHFDASTNEVTASVVKRTDIAHTARRAAQDWPHRVILYSAQPSTVASVKVPVRSNVVTFDAV
jgi:hypothetical protein